MHTLLRSIEQTEITGKIVSLLRRADQAPVAVHGVSGAVRSVLAAALAEAGAAPVLIVTAGRDALEAYANDLALLCPDRLL